MPYLTLPTHRLHYRIDGPAGDRPWLTLCNSLGTDMQMWDAQVEGLAREFRILRYDRRGHGLSSAPPPPYSLADLGADVLTLLDTLAIERTHFCGLSIGGLTAQWLAINAGARLDRIVVCATAARIGTPEGWDARIAEVQQNGLNAQLAATEERWFTPDFRQRRPKAVEAILTSFAATSTDGYLGACAALACADLRDGMDQITRPLLAISGADDPVCPPANLAAIAQGARDGRHLILPGRHIVNVESATRFNAALTDFLC
ncbi:3-oxoadipate enol-lactonase [Paracoccus sp. 11-3]|uniref:3-oxoadipate enol-lactonase n=1 Tax=Paracoccus amoyensis TaxID=2760093 RepID=A0A926JD57_9RHOB|nr:3-oxoadipate enol-lactonase [Paracoccus amoyensis]MBC9247675.1 3-oxoadipate enol-lactonase [Paracoccus amoyensis]